MMPCMSKHGDTVHYVYRLLREEGLFVGSTSGINAGRGGAGGRARDLGPGHTIVTVLCDGGAEVSITSLF